MKSTNKRLNEIHSAVKAGFDLETLLNGVFTTEQIKEMRLGKENGIDPSIYAHPEVSHEKMKTARKMLEMNVKVDPKILNIFDEDQLEEIRLGEKYKIDTSVYANPKLPASDMKVLRFIELSQKIVQSIKEKLNVFNKIKERIRNVLSFEPENAQKENEHVESVTYQELEKLDFAKIDTFDELKNCVEEKLLHGEINVEDERNDQLQPEIKEDNMTSKYNVLDTAKFYQASFALLHNTETNQYYIVSGYHETNEGPAWNQEIICDTEKEAAYQYQAALVKGINVKPMIGEISKSDLKLMDLQRMVMNEMKMSDIEKVENFIHLSDQSFSELEKLNTYLQADKIKFIPFIDGNADTLVERYAATYLEITGQAEQLKQNGLYGCINLKEYGQKLLEEHKAPLTQKGFYGGIDLHKYNVKDAKNQVMKMQKALEKLPFDINEKTFEEAKATFSDVCNRYVELGVNNGVVLNLTIHNHEMVHDLTLSRDDIYNYRYDALLNQTSALEEMLKNLNISVEDVALEDTVIEEVAPSLSM